MPTISYEANRVENYHSRKFRVELEVKEGINALDLAELAKQIVDFELDGKPSMKMKHLAKLAAACGMPEIYSAIEERILEN